MTDFPVSSTNYKDMDIKSNWASIAISLNVPGHINTLHSLVSKEGPRVEQSTPPLVSLGKEHFRVLSCVPPPQLAEQTDQ